MSKSNARKGNTVAASGTAAGSVGQAVAVAVGGGKYATPEAAEADLRSIGQGFAAAAAAQRDAEAPLRIRFADACATLGVPVIGTGSDAQFDRDSERGKMVSKYLKEGALEAIRADRGYDLMVHRVGSEDKYLPVAVWASEPSMRRFVPAPDAPVANFAITAAFALDANLKLLEGPALAPYGMKAWLRGGVTGMRPDGVGKGLRDSLLNVADQCVSRAWANTMPGGGTRRKASDLEAWLKDTVKVLESRVKSYHKENGDDACASVEEAKAAWARMAQEVMKS